MSPQPSPHQTAPASSETHDDSIGHRFNQRLAEELLEAAFASAGHAAGRPRSIGVLEVALRDGGDVQPVLGHLGPDVTLRIRQSLPRDARLVFANGAHFVMALPGDPLLEALLIVDRVRDALERETWRVDGACVDLVFEAGVSTQRGADEPLAETLEAAQRSLAQSHRLAIRRHAPAAQADEASREGVRGLDETDWSRFLPSEG